jgi:hypothetical protein
MSLATWPPMKCGPRSTTGWRGSSGTIARHWCLSTRGAWPRRGARLAAITGAARSPTTPTTTSSRNPRRSSSARSTRTSPSRASAGDIFLLGNRAWRIRRVEAGKVRVEDARGAAADDPVLARRGTGTDDRAVDGGRRAAREVDRAARGSATPRGVAWVATSARSRTLGAATGDLPGRGPRDARRAADAGPG